MDHDDVVRDGATAKVLDDLLPPYARDGDQHGPIPVVETGQPVEKGRCAERRGPRLADSLVERCGHGGTTADGERTERTAPAAPLGAPSVVPRRGQA